MNEVKLNALNDLQDRVVTIAGMYDDIQALNELCIDFCTNKRKIAVSLRIEHQRNEEFCDKASFKKYIELVEKLIGRFYGNFSSWAIQDKKFSKVDLGTKNIAEIAEGIITKKNTRFSKPELSVCMMAALNWIDEAIKPNPEFGEKWDTGELNVPTGKSVKGENRALVSLFCSLMNESGIDKMKPTETPKPYCIRICKKYGLRYSDKVRQGFYGSGNKENLEKLQETILPKMDENIQKTLRKHIASKRLYG